MLYYTYNIYLELLSQSILTGKIDEAKFWQQNARIYKRLILKTNLTKLELQSTQNNIYVNLN